MQGFRARGFRGLGSLECLRRVIPLYRNPAFSCVTGLEPLALCFEMSFFLTGGCVAIRRLRVYGTRA